MVAKSNIMVIIDDCQKQIDELEKSLEDITDKEIKDAVNNRLTFLYYNRFMYRLKAMTWGLIQF